jgi:hypothetical protein
VSRLTDLSAAAGGNDCRFDGVSGMTYMPPAAGSSALRFFFDKRPVEKATGGGGITLKGVSNESREDCSESDACGRPMPIGREREKCWFGTAVVVETGYAGPLKAGARGGAIGVPLTLDDAEEGVCACDSGCGCPTPAPLRREVCGRPIRPASNVDLRNGVCAVVELEEPMELSRDIRFLVFEAAGPGTANSPSWFGFRGVFARWDRVDFLRDVVRRTGDCVLFIGELKEKPWFTSLYCRDVSSIVGRGVGDGSNILSKSFPRLDAPCRLRRFAIGLLPVPPLRFMRPSLRLSGLDFTGGAGDKSGRRANSNLMGLSLTPSRLSMSMLSGDSALGRRAGVFSWPGAGRVMNGVALPISVDSTKARRRGLLELLLRVRGDDRRGPERRRENFFFAGAAWASGDSGYVAIGLVGLCDLGVKARAIASGEMGERGESELRSWKRDCLDGERERERRSSCR